MLTKKGTAKCDFCGQFVSWFDIENNIARGSYWEYFEQTLGGPEGPIEMFEVTCLRCLRKRRNNEEYISRLIDKINEA